MTALKKIRVREATAKDRGLFKKLWKLHLQEAFDKGDTLLPTDSNVERFARLFDHYLAEDAKLSGFVLFVADVAVLMWGADGIPFELSTGKKIRAWGVYIAPEHRDKDIDQQLYKIATKKAKILGFDGVYDQFVSMETARIDDLETALASEFQEVALVGFFDF